MPLTLDWSQVGVRLFFTILAGALIGWNRGERGHPAGLRTTLLVCLAASVAMIEANLLLDTRGSPRTLSPYSTSRGSRSAFYRGSALSAPARSFIGAISSRALQRRRRCGSSRLWACASAAV